MENLINEKEEKITLYSSSGGKVIISGEHSVVYGKPALAFSIDKQTKMDLLCYKFSSSSDFAEINLSDLDIKIIITKPEIIDIINNINKQNTFENKNDKHRTHILYVCSIFIKKILKDDISKKKEIINYINDHYFKIKISSEIPVGFGLGSSAAYNVCIINGISILINKLTGKEIFNKNDILHLSNEGEKIFHGTPSGIDVSCSLNGGIIIFENIDKQRNIDISDKNFFVEKIKYLLISTNIKRNGGEFIKKVSDFKKNNSKIFTETIDDIGKVTNDIINLISKKISDDNDCKKFFELIKLNQRLLKKIYVSNEEIDKIISLLENNGFVGKITGAGGGGFIISFVPNEKYESLIKLLDSNKISYMEIKISKEFARVNCNI